mmetsp:Transcript_23479/g.73509  ORF Transcript_23479/g.73509 Transcript_23479/m.73509 type:complete len:256 (+) Transcript_23479:674-1441(+)
MRSRIAATCRPCQVAAATRSVSSRAASDAARSRHLSTASASVEAARSAVGASSARMDWSIALRRADSPRHGPIPSLSAARPSTRCAQPAAAFAVALMSVSTARSSASSRPDVSASFFSKAAASGAAGARASVAYHEARPRPVVDASLSWMTASSSSTFHCCWSLQNDRSTWSSLTQGRAASRDTNRRSCRARILTRRDSDLDVIASVFGGIAGISSPAYRFTRTSRSVTNSLNRRWTSCSDPPSPPLIHTRDLTR